MSVLNIFATLVMPVLGVLALLASGATEGTYVLVAVIGVLAVGIGVVAFAVVLRSKHGARTVGRWADRLLDPLTRRLRHGRTLDLSGKLLDFRSSVIDVVRARWVQATSSTLLLQFTSWAILFARVASFIFIAPGGLGTVDAALTALLTRYGATSSQALAADLVWRAATYLPQVLLGALSFLWWRVTATRRRRNVTAAQRPVVSRSATGGSSRSQWVSRRGRR